MPDHPAVVEVPIGRVRGNDTGRVGENKLQGTVNDTGFGYRHIESEEREIAAEQAIRVDVAVIDDDGRRGFVPYLAIEDDRAEQGVIDEHGTPWLVNTGRSATLTGADGYLLEFDRFPWFELDGSPTAEAGDLVSDLVFVVGEPGTEFEVEPDS